MNKILKKSLYIGLPTLGVGATAVGIYLMLSNNSKQQADTKAMQQNPNSSPGTPPGDHLLEVTANDNANGGEEFSTPIYNIFPNISSYDFYKFIEISDNGPYFTDEFIAAVINKVVKDTIITDGELHYSYSREGADTLKVSFA